MKTYHFCLVLLGYFFAGNSTWAATTVYAGTAYAQRADSPFWAGILAQTIYVEDFEDSQLTPYVSFTNAEISGLARYSVDEDDGHLDGTPVGYSLAPTAERVGNGAMVFHFSPDAFGRYPIYFGFAYISPGRATCPDGVIGACLGAIAPSAELLFDLKGFARPVFPEGLAVNATEYSTFVGFADDRGIAEVSFYAPGRIDHLQYGYAIPEASVMACILTTVFTFGLRRRRC